jgi:hypothetical protein|tara:strand:- start:34 stop:207 length:174 start_codon:yes stop_codon:yes gene_type:complete
MSEPQIWFFIITALLLVIGNIILMIKITPSPEEDEKRWAYMKGEGPDPYKEKDNAKI